MLATVRQWTAATPKRRTVSTAAAAVASAAPTATATDNNALRVTASPDTERRANH